MDVDIVDAVAAGDINKLPDASVGDALQRLTGVQVQRDRGEVSSFAVRGLVQVESLLNGREIFSAGGARTLDPSLIPSEMLAGIDVWKTSAASRLEGGIGGTVDLRTRRPLDFPGPMTLLSLRVPYAELAARGTLQGSLLWSRREAVGEGVVGLLFNAAQQRRAFREDQKSTGAPTLRSDLVPGIAVVAPAGSTESASQGWRTRQGASALLQWQPGPHAELLAELHVAGLRTRQDTLQVNAGAGTGFEPGSVALFDGSRELRRVTWTDAPVTMLGFARDTLGRTRQLAITGYFDDDRGRWSADASHSRARDELFFSGPVLAGRAARFTHDLASRVPSTTLDAGLLDPAHLAFTSLAYRVRPFVGELTALRIDRTLHVDAGGLEQLAFGWRGAWRRANNGSGLVFGDVGLVGKNAAQLPDRTQPYPLRHFLDGHSVSIDQVIMPTLADARDPAGLRQAFGVSTPLPTDGAALGTWRIAERSDALYLQADGRHGAFDGHAGLRVVRTSLMARGAQSQPSSGGVVPRQDDAHTTDTLPSLVLRWRASQSLQWRAAWSRTITRPGFDQLSPSLTLLPNSVNAALNTGAAGNPALRAVRSSNVDLAVESAPGLPTAWSVTAFWRHVDGFIASASQPESHDGGVYQVTRPYNSDPARVRGAELAGQWFADEWLPGAGLRANYTLVASHTPDRRLGYEVPLQNLSRHSVNLIGSYERGPWSGRLAWNWRSRFLSGSTSGVGIGALPVYSRAYGWADGTLAWQSPGGLTLSLEGANLLRTLRLSDYGSATLPQSAWVNDRQWTLALSVSL
ncbi:TonB-dependent receptor [Pelomonas sp. P8]|uniref:TonB-dependent receptor n=2 Tax=Pelomonas cellulosilytica TaxID=2906762 RepID=A0ABS8XZE7_9BURK|nr:TonB-dependent receptor [Pelomonas sp. P8]